MRYVIYGLFLISAIELCAQLPAGGIIAYYPLNGNAMDKTGANNGALIGGVTTTEDRFGNSCGALRFNGTNGYISIPNSPGLKTITNSITIAGWFKAEKEINAGNDLDIPLLSKSGSGNLANTKAQYCLRLKRSFGDSYAAISLSSDFATQDNSYSSHPFEFNRWYFLAVTLDETVVQVYQNDKLIWQTVNSKPFVTNDLELEIGRDFAGGNKFFRGCLDDIRIFRRGLSVQEILSLYTDQSGKSGEEGILNLPDDIQKNADAGQCSAAVAFTEPSVQTGCGKIELKQVKGLPSGSLFDAGKNIIVYEATTATGKKLVDSFSVTITDKEPPVFQCPPDITKRAPENATSAIINYTIPVANDNCPNLKVELVSGLSPGAEFPIGITTVKYSATDASGNKSECSIRVILKETVKTIYHCTNDKTVYSLPNSYNAIVNYDEPLLKIRGTSILMNRTKGSSSGSLFPVGINEIVYEWDDTIAGKTVCRFTITVLDTSSPLITCPSDIKTICEAGQQSATVNYPLPIATDEGTDIPVKLASGLKSGSNFPLGVTAIKYEVVDASGNKAGCSFKVFVEEKKKEPEKILPLPTIKQEVKEQVEPVPEPLNKTVVKEKIKEAEKVPIPPVAEKEKEVKLNVKELVKPIQPLVIKKEKVEIESVPKATEKAEVKEKIKEAEETFFPIAAGKKKEDKPEEKIATAPKQEVKEPEKPVEQPIIKEKKKESQSESTILEKKEVKEKIKEAEETFFPVTAEKKEPEGKPEPSEHTVTKSKDSAPISPASFRKPCSFEDRQPPEFSDCPLDTTIHLPGSRRGVIYYYDEPVVHDNCRVDSMIQVAGSKTGCFLQIGVHPFIYKAIDPSGNFEMCTYSVIIKADAPEVKIEVPETIDADLSLGTDSVRYEYKTEVNNCYLTILIYDDGEEDNDTVSIIFNGQVIVNRDMIHIPEKGMIKRHLVLDSENENYIIAKAWNKGKYGLNTLRMDVYDGDVENDKKDLRNKKPLMSKVLHSKPGVAGGMILKCKE